MARVQYSNVYRSGAASGSPVTSIYVCDDFPDVPAATVGDIAFVKSAGLVYVGFDLGWIPIVVQDMRFNLTGNPIIQGVNPFIRLITPTTAPANAQAWNIINSAGDLYLQTVDDGGGFQINPLHITRQGNIGVYGGIFENRRASGLGYATNIPFNSVNFTCDGGTFTVLDQTYYAYSIVGNTMTLWWNLHGTFTGAPSVLYIKIGQPAIARVTAPLLNTCVAYDTVVGWSAQKVYTNPGWDSIAIARLNFTNWAAGDFYTMGQIQFPVTGI